MKSLIKPARLTVVAGLMVLFGATFLFTQEASQIKPSQTREAKDTLAQETYVSEVILQAPWAEKNLVDDGEESPPGEFGIRVYSVPESLKEFGDVPPPEGPTSFTVAPNGDIYITDPFNKRIQRFDENGNFVSVIPIPPLEKSKYLHIQELPELSDSARVETLRRAGKLPKRDDQNRKELKDLLVEPKTTNGYQWYWKTICVDQDNNLYLRWDEPNKVCVRKYDQTGKLMTTYPIFGLSEGPAGTGLYCDKEFDQYDSSRNTTIKFPSRMTGSFLGVDEKGRIYTKSFTYDTSYNTTTFIRKFDDKGNLISTIAWDTVFGSSWGSGYWRGAREIVDTKGNIFVYYSTKDGITITKWYKKP
jgi:hypothetical protein